MLKLMAMLCPKLLEVMMVKLVLILPSPLPQPTRGKDKAKLTKAAAGEETAQQDNSLTQEQRKTGS